MALPTAITAYYNGVTFPSNLETTDVSIRPTYDASGRTVKFVTYDLTFRFVVGEINQALNQTTDATLEALRVLLTAPAGNFKYQNAGLGLNLDINPAGGGGIRDVVWGPKPQLIRWKPYGNVSCEVTWSVQFCIPECTTAQYALHPMEFVFRLAFAIDNSGYTTRTYSGHVAIPQTRTTPSSRTLTDQADRLRENINPPLIPGFRRTPGQFTLSEDKCKLEFNITDEEVGPNYPPPGVIHCNLSHSVTSDAVFGGMWNATVTAEYEVPRNVDRSTSFNHFLIYLAERMRDTAVQKFRGMFDGKIQDNVVIMTSFTAAHPDVYGRRAATFTASYTFLSSVVDLVRVSGLWKPVPNSNWQQWATSLQETAFHPRGNARLAFTPANDVIIDLCQPGQATLAGTPPPQPPAQQPPSIPPFNTLPPPERSWLRYDNRIKLEPNDHSIRVKTLPDAPLRGQRIPDYVLPPTGPTRMQDLRTEPSRASAAGIPAEKVGVLQYYPATAKEDTVHLLRASPSLLVRLTGYGIRVGYAITPPAIVQYGGKPVAPVNGPGNGFEQWLLASWFGLPVYACTWNLVYAVMGLPRNGVLPLMDTPFANY